MQFKDLFKYTVAGNDCEQQKLFEFKQITNMVATVFDNIFTGIDFYMFYYIQQANKQDQCLTPALLDAFTQFNLPSIVKKYQVRTQAIEEFSLRDASGIEAACIQLRLELMSYMEELISMQYAIDFEINNFKADLLKLKIAYLQDLYLKALQEGMQVSSEMDAKRSGIEDAVEVTRKRFNDIDVYKGYFDSILMNKLEQVKPTIITTTSIKPIDDAVRGLYSQTLTVIAGGPGSGKTTFSLSNPIYQAIMLNKKNVLYFSVEQSDIELQNKLLSRFIADIYKKMLNPQAIRAGDYDNSPEVNIMIQTAKMKLFGTETRDAEYGTIDFVSFEDIYSNTIIETTKKMEALHKKTYDVVVIDYMYQLEHKQQGRESLTREAITREAYAEAKKLAMTFNKCVIAVEQLNQAGVENVSKGKLVENGNFAGGANVDRYADNIFVITGTKEEKDANICYLQTVKTRNAGAIPRLKFKMNLMCGIYRLTEGAV